MFSVCTQRRHIGRMTGGKTPLIPKTQHWIEVFDKLFASVAVLPGELALGSRWIGGAVGPRGHLDVLEKMKRLCPCRGSNPRLSSPFPRQYFFFKDVFLVLKYFFPCIFNKFSFFTLLPCVCLCVCVCCTAAANCLRLCLCTWVVFVCVCVCVCVDVLICIFSTVLQTTS